MNYDDIELAPNARWVHESSAEVGIKQIDGHTGSVKSVQLLQNDSKIFTVSDDFTARIWDFVSGKEVHRFSNLHENCIANAKVNEDSSKFITCSWDKSIKCWNLKTGQLLWRNDHAYLLTSCGFSHDGKYVVSASDVDYKVSIWDAQTGSLIDTIHDLHSSTITSCQFSPKNDRIVTTSMDKSTKFYDMIAKKLTITLGSHSNIISNCSFTPDERTFATCSWDKTINIWDISTGMYRKEGPTTMSKGHEGSISSCYLSPDGTLCVSGGYDSRLVLWDMDHGTAKLVLRGHSDWLNDVTLTRDNRWIVSVGKDHEIREWDICNSDNIKLVIEQNRNLGNKLIKCSICLRTFTISKLQKTGEMKMLCVFCRLQEQALINNEIDPAYLFTNNE